MKRWHAFLAGFFDGFGPGALFVPVRQPGAPTKVFADEGEDWSVEELEDPSKRSEG